MRPRSPTSGNNNHSYTTGLLCLNAVLMVALLVQFSGNNNSSISNGSSTGDLLVAQHHQDEENDQQQLRHVLEAVPQQRQQATSEATQGERDFLSIAKKTFTDKVEGHKNLKLCLETGSPCTDVNFEREQCRPWGHFYDTLYQRWLGPTFSKDSTPAFQFLEIGFYSGLGFLAFQEFMPKAEAHSIELSCKDDGKDWPLGNTAKSDHPDLYNKLRSENRLHCGSAIDYDFLDTIWTTYMRRANAPPLKVVVDDASHVASQMIVSVFYWFPKIEPGGFLIVEDIQPIEIANKFRTQFLPQLISDIHWCGGSKTANPEQAFFDTLWPLLASVSCEMHICILERNQQPAQHNLSRNQLTPPVHALDYQLALQTRKTSKSLK